MTSFYGTRAVDNQGKAISSVKANKEGHNVDAIADGLFRITLMVCFRRRGGSQASNVEKLINALADARDEESFSGFVITADCRYGKMSMVPGSAKKDIGFIFRMHEHL